MSFMIKVQFQEKISRQGFTLYYQCISGGEERLPQMEKMDRYGSWGGKLRLITLVRIIELIEKRRAIRKLRSKDKKKS